MQSWLLNAHHSYLLNTFLHTFHALLCRGAGASSRFTQLKSRVGRLGSSRGDPRRLCRAPTPPVSPICTGHLPYNSYQPWPPPSAPLILDLPPPRSESTSSMAFYGNTSFLDNCDDLSLGKYPSWRCPRGSTSAELAWGQLQLGAVISQLASLGGSDKWLHSTITKGFNYSVLATAKQL